MLQTTYLSAAFLAGSLPGKCRVSKLLLLKEFNLKYSF